MSLREDIEAGLAENRKPSQFVLTTLRGREVNIHAMTARDISRWWAWVYEEPRQPKRPEAQYAELFARCCVDGDDKKLYTSAAEIKALIDDPGFGRVAAEFFGECRKRNFLYENGELEEAARASFFGEKNLRQRLADALAEIGKLKSAAILLTDSSATLPPPAENPIR